MTAPAPQHLRGRLAALEASARAVPAAEEQRLQAEREQAADALFDALDPLYQGREFTRIAGLNPLILTRHDRLKQAAKRIEAGEPNDEDRATLAALPAVALARLGVTAEAFLIYVGTDKLPRQRAS